MSRYHSIVCIVLESIFFFFFNHNPLSSTVTILDISDPYTRSRCLRTVKKKSQLASGSRKKIYTKKFLVRLTNGKTPQIHTSMSCSPYDNPNRTTAPILLFPTIAALLKIHTKKKEDRLEKKKITKNNHSYRHGIKIKNLGKIRRAGAIF